MFDNIPDIATFEKYSEKEIVLADTGEVLPGVRGEFYKKIVGAKTISVGIFSANGKLLYCAWGDHAEVHCGMHAVMGTSGTWLSPEAGCPIKIAKKDGDKVIALEMPTKDGVEIFPLSPLA